MGRPRLNFRRDDNQTDSNSTTSITPDANVPQHDTVIITLSIGKIIFSVHIIFYLFIFIFYYIYFLFIMFTHKQ